MASAGRKKAGFCIISCQNNGVGNNINKEEELAKLQEELKYKEGFLASVLKKLENESFVSKAPEKVIEMERKKQAGAESKIKSLQESIEALSNRKLQGKQVIADAVIFKVQEEKPNFL